MKLDIWVSFETLSRKFWFQLNPIRITGTLHKDVFTFMTISRCILLRMGNVSNISCRENQNTHFMFNNFFSENRAVYEIMSKHYAEPEKQQAMWRMRAAYWINKATREKAHVHALATTYIHTHTHTEVCNTYCFSTATMVSWRRLIVTLCVHCLSCFVTLYIGLNKTYYRLCLGMFQNQSITTLMFWSKSFT